MPPVTNPTRLDKATKKLAKRESLWKGPQEDGITFSMLVKFLECRERFRLLVVEGIKPKREYSRYIEFGSSWHECEQALAGNKDWRGALNVYTAKLIKNYPLQQEEIVHWHNIIAVQFPIYIKYWAEHEDVKNRTPIYQEEVFDVQYELPTGDDRIATLVRLRGKFDAVDLIKDGKRQALYIQENKSKSEINEQQIKRQLGMDLQTMTYVVALGAEKDRSFWNRANKRWRDIPIGGVRYNVICRPLSSRGKHNIRQRQGRGKAKAGAETKAEFYKRLADEEIAPNPKDFFLRLKVEIEPNEIIDFRKRCFDKILFQLVQWWDSIKADPFNPWNSPYHWITPYGCYSTLSEGRHGGYDDYVNSGTMLGLEVIENLYPELT